MEDVKLMEKVLIAPEKPTKRRRIFLSNIDLSLVVYIDSVTFFDPPPNQMSFSEVCNTLKRAVSELLVTYDFLAGRLVPALEETHRLEIDCNGAGAVVAAATTESKLSQFGELMAPKPEFRQLVAFVQDEAGMELKDKPILLMQLTQFGCGSLALSLRFYHCAVDGIAASDVEANMAALTRGEDLAIIPNPDRTIFKARNPPKISHPHYEYSRGLDADHSIDADYSFTVRGTSGTTIEQVTPQKQTHLIYLSPQQIASLKKAVLMEGKLENCTTFQVVAAKIWKARSIAVEMAEERISTMLFPVDARKRVVPQAPPGFSGNALIPGFARASVRELKEKDESYLVKKVQEGLERLDDEYVRSGIDWLEVNRGVPCREGSFSLVAWWRLGLEEKEFAWGRVKCATPIIVRPGLVILLPGGPKGEGGLNICLQLPEDQIKEFRRLMMED
ncbi:hypothetical protein L1049_005285 [Liquidambar formosana]|uniref:Omega-hydroxypalmitate O-feruloyl transferase n=1 Tax=Liquidambar formosana TaxID=63359 RepID=A0AAP0X1C2_LIQFO